MEIILLERIEKLGQMGDVVTVRPGYARNFLLPQGKAMRATDTNKKIFENQRAQLEANNLEYRNEAQAVSEKLNGLSIVMLRQAGDAGQLYGSVNARDIATAVIEAGFTITRQQVNLSLPIKTLGLFDVTVQLHPEVSTTISVNVARSTEEAKIQAEIGGAIVSVEEEESRNDKGTTTEIADEDISILSSNDNDSSDSVEKE